MRVSFHPGAEQDLNEAIDYYNARQTGLGERFLHAVDLAIDSILQDPERLPVVQKQVRRERVQRFPYDVYFRVDGDAVRILAVKHDARDASYWTHRI